MQVMALGTGTHLCLKFFHFRVILPFAAVLFSFMRLFLDLFLLNPQTKKHLLIAFSKTKELSAKKKESNFELLAYQTVKTHS